tara:strand:- start:514 stop:1155 length:642 start_codon:yes stop_codon:yes gene_type:complete
MKSELLKRILSAIILIPLVAFFIIKGGIYFNFFILVCFLIALYEWHMMSKNKLYSLYGYIFLFFSFYSTYLFRNELGNEMLFLFVIIICISTDIGGYIFGKIFKGPKLTKLSPKKTYSGVIGSFFLSIILISLFINYSILYGNNFIGFSFKTYFLIIIISSISQIGDLVISYFKRLSKIKDTGKIIPGHGGILDRIDGMIFAFPSSYLIFKIL